MRLATTALSIIAFVTTTAHALNINGTKVLRLGVLLPQSDLPDWILGVRGALSIYADKNLMQRSSLIDNDTRIEFLFGDSKAIDALAVYNAFQLQNQGVVAVIGAAYSGNSESASLVLQNYQIPMCCGSSTSPTLSDKGEYPNFFRTVPNDNMQGYALCNYIVYHGWQKFAMISVLDGYGSGLNTVVTECARSQNLTILTQQTFYSGDTNFTSLLTNVQSVRARIIVYLGYPDELIHMGQQARQMGLWTSDTAWLSVDGAYELFTETQYSLEDRANAAGLVLMFPREAVGSLANDFLDLWNQYGPSYLGQDQFDLGVQGYTYFFINCLEMMVMGYDRLLSSNSNYTVQDILNGNINNIVQIPESFSFPDRDSVTGPVVLDQYGDRAGSFVFLNSYQGHLYEVGNYVGGQVSMTAPVRYDDNGTTTTPGDSLDIASLATFVSINNSLSITFVIIAVIGLLATFVSAVLIFVHRKKRIIRNASPIMSVIILVGICIGFTQVFVMIGKPTNTSCHIDIWIVPLSFSIIFGALIAKTQRIYRIFSGIHMKLRGTQDIHTVAISAVFVFIEIFILAAWSIDSKPVGTILEYVPNQYQWTCQSTHQSTFTTILIVYNSLMLFIGLILAFLTRGVMGQFRETNRIGACVYSIVLCTLLGLPIAMTSSLDNQIKFVIKLSALYFSLFFLLVALFGVQIWQVVMENEGLQEKWGISNTSKGNMLSKSTGNLSQASFPIRFPHWTKEDSALVQVKRGMMSRVMPETFHRSTILLDVKLGILTIFAQVVSNLDKGAELMGVGRIVLYSQAAATMTENTLTLDISGESLIIQFDNAAKAQEWFDLLKRPEPVTKKNTTQSVNVPSQF